MITRFLQKSVQDALKSFPAVAVLGARQVGKTTLAKEVARQQKKAVIYLDLENPIDRNKLHDSFTYLNDNKEKLIIIDEIQRMPNLFAELRSLIDVYRKSGRFILLGSASPDLVKGVSETLAGRILYTYLHTVSFAEGYEKYSLNKQWMRGGFPEMLTSKNDLLFAQRTDTFITTFIERDLQNLFGVNFTNSVMRNFWTMLAHNNGSIWNAQYYARSLGITAPTINRYLDFLEGAFMVHKLPAFYFQATKRVIKASKVYLRDTGILHRLLRITALDELRGHPIIGLSWEGYVVEQIYQLKHSNLEMYYYRTQDGAEADVVLTKANNPVACIEIKLSNSPVIAKGFYETMSDLKTKQNFVVVPQVDSYRKAQNVIVCGLSDFLLNHLPKIR